MTNLLKYLLIIPLLLLTTHSYSQSLQLLYPNGGENLVIGKKNYIQWFSENIQYLKVELSIDNGQNYYFIKNVKATPQYAQFTIPYINNSKYCLIKLTNIANPTNFDDSDNIFFAYSTYYNWKYINEDQFYARDGAGALVFKDKMWLLGGWNSTKNPECNSEIWSSIDGYYWTLETIAPWEGRHCAGYVVFKDKMWVIGGDSNSGHYQMDVWNSSDGINWNKILNTMPIPPRVTHYVVAFSNKIWLMGGQEIPGTLVYNDVWNTENGISWQKITDHANWSPRGQIMQSVVFNDNMWIIGGGTYNEPKKYYNDVWKSYDGKNWECVRKKSPWQPRQYHSTIVHNYNKILIIGGFNVEYNNLNDVWCSVDGYNWSLYPDYSLAPWLGRHAISTFSFNGSVYIVGGSSDETINNDVWRLGY